MSKLITLYINSKDRINREDPLYNYTYRLNLGVYDSVNYYIKSVELPQTTYASIYNGVDFDNIIEPFQRFTLIDAGGPVNVIIPSGNYSADDLATLIQAEMISVGSQSYNVSYSSFTNKFTISAPLNFTMTFTGQNYRFPYQSLGVSLGYRDENHNPLNQSDTNSYTGEFQTNLSGHSYYVQSHALSIYNLSYQNKEKRDIVAKIPNDRQPFGVITWFNELGGPSMSFQKLDGRMNYIDIALLDHYGNYVFDQTENWEVVVVIKCND